MQSNFGSGKWGEAVVSPLPIWCLYFAAEPGRVTSVVYYPKSVTSMSKDEDINDFHLIHVSKKFARSVEVQPRSSS
jgi:hypothetical protein